MNRLFFVFAVFLSLPNVAFAACPAAPVGDVGDRVIQFVQNGDGQTAEGPTSSIDATEEGAVVYDASNNTIAVCDGTNWITLGTGSSGSSYEIISQTTINSSQTYNIPGTALPTDWVVVGLVGGGGSGATDNDGSGVVAASGGGGGGYAEAMAKVSDLPSSLPITVGSGGTAVAANDSNGIDGGDTYIGDLSGLGSVMNMNVDIWVTGGQGGQKNTTGVSALGGRVVQVSNPWIPVHTPLGIDSVGKHDRTGGSATIETGTTLSEINPPQVGYTGVGGTDRSGGAARPTFYRKGRTGLIPASVGGRRGNATLQAGDGAVGAGGGASYCYGCGAILDSGAGGKGQVKIWIIRGDGYKAGDIYSIP